MSVVQAQVGQTADKRRVWIVFSGLMLGMLIASLDQTLVATALPTIVSDLGGLNQLSWVVTGYLLASTASTPLWGKLGVELARKNVVLKLGDYLVFDCFVCSKVSGLTYCNVEWTRTGL